MLICRVTVNPLHPLSADFFYKEVIELEAEILAVKYLGIALIVLIVGIVLCFLASLGYNTYIKFQDKHKKIEVRAENSNSLDKR